jgi:hypothetical protein
MMRTHYVQELESVQQNLVQMGGTTLSLLAEALSAMADPRSGPSERASELEAGPRRLPGSDRIASEKRLRNVGYQELLGE